MAFLGEDGWKAGLPAQQLAKIAQLEKQRDSFKTELSKKCINFDILQQTLEKEKNKVDEVRSQLAASLREKQEVHENWLELERRHEKLQHDYAVKEAHNHALQGQMDLKVKQLEEAQCRLKVKPEAIQQNRATTTTISGNTRRSLPSTPSEDVDTWSKFNITKELEEARKLLRVRDQEILQLRAQVPKTPPHVLTSPIEANKMFKSSLQIAERSKTSSISFDSKETVMQRPSHLQVVPDDVGSVAHLQALLKIKENELQDLHSKYADLHHELSTKVDENHNHQRRYSSSSKEEAIEESERKNSSGSGTKMAMDKLKFELEDEKAQKSFYQAKHKEASAELQAKSLQLEETKKRLIALENESLAKQSELKKIKNSLEEKDNDIGQLSHEKDGLRSEVKELQSKVDAMKSKMGNLESLITSKDAKMAELKSQLEEQKVDLDHKSSSESSLGGQLAALRDEKAAVSKELLNANKINKELEAQMAEKNGLIEELQARMELKQKDAAHAGLKWQTELVDASNKIIELTKKCKALTEELLFVRKESQEVNETKMVDLQKAQDVRAEKQTIEVELKTMAEKFERECDKRQAAMKEVKDLEIQLSETQTLLKLANIKLKELEDENKTLKSDMESTKSTLNQSLDEWSQEKVTLINEQQQKFKQKDTEVEKLREIRTELDEVKFDLEKEKTVVNGLRDMVEAKEVTIEKLDSQVKELQSKLEFEVAGKNALLQEVEDIKTSKASSQVEIASLKSDKDDLQTEVQSLKEKLHQFKKKSADSEMDYQKTSESINLMEDKTKILEDKLRGSEVANEELQDKLKAAQETIYEHSIQLKKIQAEKSAMENDLSEVTINLEALRAEKDSLMLESFELSKYKDEVTVLRKEKERLSEKVDALWKEVKDHQDLIHASEKEHMDLRRELEAQIRDKDDESRQLKMQVKELQKSQGESKNESSCQESNPEEPSKPPVSMEMKPKESKKVPRKKVPSCSKKSVEEKLR